ncbi:MAG: DUF1638 domain-containing protein [Limisphaerales bacterium]
MSRLRLHVIACPVFQRELEFLAADAKPEVTFRHLEIKLHAGAANDLRAALQNAIDDVAAGQCDAIAIAYGLCNRGVVGLQARALPIVIPRAHDCIGMLLGSNRDYLAQLEAQPGTLFQSAGWLEHLPANGEIRRQDFTCGPDSNVTREQLVDKYGEDNADYLLEQFNQFTQHYGRLAYIATPAPRSAHGEAAAKEIARARGWKFERLAGDLGWLRRLLNAEWNDREFLTLKPGERVGLRTDAGLIGAEPA